MTTNSVKLSTASEALARLNTRIAAEQDTRRKKWLTTYRDHWWGEVIGDVDAVMVTMSRGPISYSFDGHPFMTPDEGLAAIDSYAATRAMYEGVVALGVKMAGPVDNEEIYFSDTGLIVHCVLSAIYPGIYLTKHTEPVDPQGFYLMRWPSATIIHFDGEGLMMGEDIMNGAPILIQKVDKSKINSLVEGPLPKIA
jgi:hypothetical protein